MLPTPPLLLALSDDDDDDDGLGDELGEEEPNDRTTKDGRVVCRARRGRVAAKARSRRGERRARDILANEFCFTLFYLNFDRPGPEK